MDFCCVAVLSYFWDFIYPQDFGCFSILLISSTEINIMLPFSKWHAAVYFQALKSYRTSCAAFWNIYGLKSQWDDSHDHKIVYSNILCLQGSGKGVWVPSYSTDDGMCVCGWLCIERVRGGGSLDLTGAGGFLWMEQWKVEALSCGHSVCLLFILLCLTW